MSGGKTIGIDARMARHSGIGTYLTNLLREMSALRKDSLEIFLYGLPQGANLQLSGFSERNFSSRIYSLSEQWEFWRESSGVDVWHAPHYNAPYFSRSPLVVTIHDLIPFVLGGQFFSPLKKIYLQTLIGRIAKTARRIIAVSDCTKQDLIKYFNVPEEKIRVIHEGVNGQFLPVRDKKIRDEALRNYGIPSDQPFLLYVGLLKPHKNLSVLIDAVRQLRRAGKIREKLVIVGKKDLQYPSASNYLAQIKTDEDLFYIPYLETGELPVFYSAAQAFVMPSLYEGFGLPVLEAFACGTPVIVSNRASLPEIAGDAALSFEADSVEDLKDKILRLTSNVILQEEFRGRGEKRLELFSWKKMAQETLDIYREVLCA